MTAAKPKNPGYVHLEELPDLGSKTDLQISIVLNRYARLQILYTNDAFTRGFMLFGDDAAGKGSTYTIWVPEPWIADAFLARYARGPYMPCLWREGDDDRELPRTANPFLKKVGDK